jgi:hypothetical protein
MEQHSTLILGEQRQAGVMKQRKRTEYELIDKKLQLLVSTFHTLPIDIYLKKARTLFNF